MDGRDGGATLPPMKRRRLLKIGAVSAAALAGAGALLMNVEPGLREGKLTDAGRAVFRAVARAVLDGALPAGEEAAQRALDAHLGRLDGVIAGFAPPVQDEITQLVTLLASAAGRIGLTGLRPAWPEASVEEISAALTSLRYSSLELRQQTYHALRDLTNAAYFADESTWPLLGYPGPQALQ
jgi:hypothetical protein